MVNGLCGMLVITAYESAKERNDHSPVFEFFRHVRNAASIQNSFKFRPREQSRTAGWCSLRIDESSKGEDNPLFGEACFDEFLLTADALFLLWDIE